MLLKSTSNEPKINPLKYALNSKSTAVRARIQIQRSIHLPKPPNIQKEIHIEQSELIESPDLNQVPIELPDFPELVAQLRALGIEKLQSSVIPIIKEHAYAFRDGVIPKNLPKGFYISKDKKTLCYTEAPRRLPSALAPVLKKLDSLTLPSIEEATTLFTNLSRRALSILLETKYSTDQKNILFGQLPKYENEVKTLLLQLYRSTEPAISTQQHDEFIIPLLCKQYLLGGESHTALLVRLLNACLNKKINLEFLKNPEVQNSLLSVHGIKNLQKLIQLPAEQREWWDKLVVNHLKYNKNSFDFNTFLMPILKFSFPELQKKI